MRIVVALGGNALLLRGQTMTAQALRTNIRIAALALADLARDRKMVVAHYNGPQMGFLDPNVADPSLISLVLRASCFRIVCERTNPRTRSVDAARA
jgi:hypothetical protein